MGQGHNHTQGLVSSGAKHTRALKWALGLTLTYLVVEVVAGVAFNSLALISDAGHMATDTVGLAMALAAITFAQGASTDRRTFGRYRLETLASLANAALLFGVAFYVLFEAVGRFQDPSEVPGAGLMAVATAGLIVNVVAFALLRSGAKESLNLRGAYLEVMADMIGSVGVLLAGLVVLLTGWPYADPIIGVGIGLFVLPRAYQLGRSAIAILMEHAPDHIDVAAVRQRLASVPGVEEVHDLHIWTLTSGTDIATVHLRATPGAHEPTILSRSCALFREEFGISHATVQVEGPSYSVENEPAI